MWKKIVPSVYYYSNGIIDPNKKWDKIAMFDLDYTLIQPKTSLHPKDVKDWKWSYPNVIEKLLKLIDEKYLIVIVSNQAGLKKREWLLTRIEIAMEQFIGEYDPNHLIPFKIFVPFEDDVYRKPNTKIFEEFIYPNLTEDYEEIFYVGDMESDRKFAYNISMFLKFKSPDDTRVKFYGPEEFFLDAERPDRIWEGFDAAEFARNAERITSAELREKLLSELQTDAKLILLIGPPASGKSTIAKMLKTLLNAHYISRDLCHTKAKCIKQCETSLPETVILDNTNAAIEDRAHFIKLAKEKNIPVYAIVMDHFHDQEKNKLLYKQLNIMRMRMGGAKIPDLVYNIFYKNYQPPTTDEGIDKIITLPFYPIFRTAEQKFRFLQKI
jgi:bifunctional polynucleotide phosphatase/kinase